MKLVVAALCILSCNALAGTSEHTAVMAHYLCAGGLEFDFTMARLKGQALYGVAAEARECLEAKLSAAISEAEKEPDLKAAVKSFHVKAITYSRDPHNAMVEKDFQEAISVLELEGKQAGVWH